MRMVVFKIEALDQIPINQLGTIIKIQVPDMSASLGAIATGLARVPERIVEVIVRPCPKGAVPGGVSVGQLPAGAELGPAVTYL